ncbi:MAG: 23S rRNA (pseudouridine(1915)-N(3))-methyltransferase RlmH [Nitratireductor sp.]|nr:23S rRNA (pseudouridine(1915)-N(3))-methyltransferase RlmH [Nitratireductor sp.]MCC0021941.1 23S rRNA (pseudouridine(1915)-N(3))-methyltransferase RlmH [Nitratireductor sp.]
MHLDILAIGKMKKGPETDLFERYCDRAAKAGRNLGLNGPHLHEWPEDRGTAASLRMKAEAERMLTAARPGSLIICLDERGKDISSAKFAGIVETAMQSSVPALTFAIGGPDGHGDAMRGAAAHMLRFGSMTWPHQLARVMLAEQIYRAITILSGHPYHRE